MHLGADDAAVAQRQQRIGLGDQPGPVAQQVEGGDGRHHQHGQRVEDGEAAADHPRQRTDRERDHRAGMGADDLAQFVVDEIGAEMLLQMGQGAIGPGLHLDHVIGHAFQQQPDLREDDGIEQEGEGQHHREQADDEHDGGEPAGNADLGHAHGEGIEEIGDAGRGHEGQQDRGEEVEEQQGHEDEPGDERDPLVAGRERRRRRRRGRRRGRARPCHRGRVRAAAPAPLVAPGRRL
jgi:hypothetical protein